MTSMLELAKYYFSIHPPKIAKDLLRYAMSDEERKDDLLKESRRTLSVAQRVAREMDEKTARDWLSFYQKNFSMDAMRQLAADKKKVYDRQLKNLRDEREDLNKDYDKFSKIPDAQKRLLESYPGRSQSDPREWVEDAFGVGGVLNVQEGEASFVGDDSPAMYLGLQMAAGAGDDYFLGLFEDLGVEPDDLYELYVTDKAKFSKRLDELVSDAKDLEATREKDKESLKDIATQAERQNYTLDTIESYFPVAMRSFVKSQVLGTFTGEKIAQVNETINALETPGAIQDYATAEARRERYDDFLQEVAVFQFDGDVDKARAFFANSLTSEGLTSPDETVSAIALSSADPSLASDLNSLSAEEKVRRQNAAIEQMYRNRVDPSASMIANLFRDLETFNENSAFKAWREASGIVSTAPPGLAEFQRYNRQVKRVGSPLYRAKRTGDVREVTVVDEQFAIPTRTAGVMSFTADGKYLTGQELERMSAEQLASDDTRYVEIDLSEDEVRERVFGSVATPEMREELLQFGKTKGFQDRARMVYDKQKGDFVILDDDLTVVFKDRVENPSALLTDVNDSRFAEPAGSAKDFQANKAQNRLSDDEFTAMMALEEGAQATQLAGYLPAQRAKVATKTFMGELTFIPGQDELTFSYLTVGPDGRRQTRTFGINDLIDQKIVTDDDEGFARYRELTGATDEATPRERRQFNRLFRSPLFDKKERGSRRARVQAGDLVSEVETYQAEDTKPRESVVETPEVSEETSKEGDKAKKPEGKASGTGGVQPGPAGAALRAGAGASAATDDDILPTSRKLVMDAVSGSGAAPGFEPSLDVGQIGRTVPPFEAPSPPLSDLEAAGMPEAYVPTLPTPTLDTKGSESGLDDTLAGITATRGLPADKVPIRRALLGLAERGEKFFGSTADAVSAQSRALTAAAEESEDEQKKKEEEAVALSAAAPNPNS